jgi:hypothetical protein
MSHLTLRFSSGSLPLSQWEIVSLESYYKKPHVKPWEFVKKYMRGKMTVVTIQSFHFCGHEEC